LLKERPNVGAAVTASRADEPGLKIRQPNVITPLLGIHDDVVSAMRAMDKEPARAARAHFTERYLLFSHRA
jgi:hypothetical protein